MRYVPVEEARKRLGKLVREASSGEPVIIGRRGADQVILLSQEEYERLRRVEEKAAQLRFRETLEAIGATVADQKLPRKIVDEAVRAARQ